MTPLSADTATFFIGSSPHMRSVLSTYEDRGEPMPFAFVVGTHPAYEVLASYSVPTHLERFGELDLVGNLLDGPAELVPAETVDLEVPASAEVVIEGVVRPGDRVDEGPGPSQWLYYYPGVSRQPVFEATAVLRRENPVFRQVDTIVFSDHQPLLTLPAEALLFEELRENGHDVLDVRYVPWGGTVCCVLQVTPRHASRVREAMLLAMGTRWPNAKLVIAVDDDVDIGDPRELLWSISTRVDPERDVFTVPAAAGHPADPSARDIEGAPGTAEVGRLGIDACKPGTARPASRDRFRRARPMGMDDVDLEDYL